MLRQGELPGTYCGKENLDGFVQNGPRMWCSLGGEESVRISLRNLPGVMLSRNEGDAGLAAEVRKNATFEASFEHF